MTPTGERIRTARTLLGISQEELARATGVSQEMVSAVENGSRLATDDFLAQAAATTALPRSFFSAVPPDLPPGTLRFRKLASAKRSSTRRTEALLGEAFRVASDLLAEVNYPPPSLPICQGEPSHADIEHLASDTRHALGIEADGPIRHVTRACERGGIAVIPLSFHGEDVPEGETVGHFGASYWGGGTEPAIIGYFWGGPGDRQRYTLAHELGHLVLHSRRRVIHDPEAEANYFAGAFLLPKERITEALTGSPVTLRNFHHMKAHWGVSMQALIMRGSELGIIDPVRKTSLFKQLSARGWRKAEPVTVHQEHPVLIWKMLAAKYGKEATYQRAADPLGLGAVILRGIAPPPVA